MDVLLKRTSRKDAKVLQNMYSFYLHDLSAYASSLKENSEGTFLFDSFSLFWKREGVNPYFIMANGEKAGFILLLEPPFTKNIDYIINDFFLYNRFRGKGIGEQAVKRLFAEKPGSYSVGQLTGNTRAIAFWKKVYELNSITFEESEDQEEEESIICQEFTVPKPWE